MSPSPAWIPILVLATPLVFALLALVSTARVRPGLWVAGSAATLALAFAQARAILLGGPISALGDEVRADGIGAVMALLISFIALACSIYALAYLPGRHPREPERGERLVKRMRLFTALFLTLEFTLLWVVMTNNIVLLWVALEATTLASALLVSFYWDARALEAGYKDLLLLTVGMPRGRWSPRRARPRMGRGPRRHRR